MRFCCRNTLPFSQDKTGVHINEGRELVESHIAHIKLSVSIHLAWFDPNGADGT